MQRCRNEDAAVDLNLKEILPQRQNASKKVSADTPTTSDFST